MPNRPILAVAATALAVVAAIVSGLDGDADLVPFFAGLAVAGGIGAWAVRDPYEGRRVWLAQLIGLGWLVAATIIGALLIWQGVLCGCSSPPLPPEATYLGLTATAYHIAAVYLGGACMVVAAFSRSLSRDGASGHG